MNLGLFAKANGDRPLLAIGLLIVGTFTLALQDSLMKLMSTETSFWQIQTLRSGLNMVIVIMLALLSGKLMLIKPQNAKPVFLRAAFLAITMFFFFSGAPYLSVAQMAVGLYTYPLFVCLLAGPVLGEKIGLWRTACIVLGACGAALVLAPWKESFSPIQILPMVAGFFYACNILTLRRACRNESTLALAFAAGIVFSIVGLSGIAALSVFPLSSDIQHAMPFVAIGWPELTMLVAGFALLVSMLNLLGNICMTRAYQTANASLLAPIDFSYLIFAAFWGKVIFDKWPQDLTLIGMCLIIFSGVIIAWREHTVGDQQHTAVAS